LLLDQLEARLALAARINIPVWKSVRDKAVAGRGRLLKLLLRLLASYPAALVKLMRQPARSAVLLGYPAIPDIFVVWPVARLRRHRIIFDAFVSLYDTVVSDRQMVRRSSLAAKLAWATEWLALRMADVILVDTDEHGDFFAGEFGIPRQRFQTILVGAEQDFWNARGGVPDANQPGEIRSDLPTILFYGQLIPLHGLDTILDAIERSRDEPIHWLLIGSGQEEPKLRRFLAEHRSDKVTWRPWVDYEQLPAIISAADVALGIFGTSDKAARVIPNKAFQVLAVGKPLITRESPAVAGIKRQFPNSIRTVPAGDGVALAQAVHEAVMMLDVWQPVPAPAQAQLGPEAGVKELLRRVPRSGGRSVDLRQEQSHPK
jgi:glycosyltransferase involved in cell wall biosynthesis